MNASENSSLYEKLTGRKLPIVVGEGDVPAPTSEMMIRRSALANLVATDDFAVFLALARERAFQVLDGKKSFAASELELRIAKAQYEMVAELGPMVINFLRETDELIEQRQNWLESQQKNQQTPTSETKL